jgi:SprB repeat/Secretion system C-terminal sorting domain
MRSYQKFGVVIIAQLICTTLLAQSLRNVDLNIKWDRSSKLAYHFDSPSFIMHEKNLLKGKNKIIFSVFDHTVACKKTSEKSKFLISRVGSYPMTFKYLTKSTFDIFSLEYPEEYSSNLSRILRNEEKAINPFHAGIRRVIHPKCHGTSTGSIKARASGGTKPYQYLWSNGSTRSEIIGISKGTYTVTITDAAGNFVIESATLTEPEPLHLEVISNSPSCYGNNDGSALFHATGGTPFPYKKSLYTTLWSNAQSKGIMFDISTNTKITLSSISIHLPETHLQTISIYFKTGSMVGSEFDSTQWQLLSTTQMNGAGLYEESHIQIMNSPILNPGLYSLYIYNHNGEMLGFEGPYVGNAFNHGHILTVFEGIRRDSSSSPFQSAIGMGMNMAGKITFEAMNDNGFAYNNNFQDGQWYQKQFSSGQHQITMKDVLGCTLTQSFTIPAADSIKIISETIKSPRCSYTNDGEIKLIAQPAEINYQSMSPIPFANPAFGSMIHFNSSQNISLKGFELFLNRSGPISVYMKSGNYEGNENNSTSWIPLGNYLINKSSNSSTTQLLLSSPSLLPSGDWSFYIYSTDDLFNQLDSIAFYDNHSLNYINSSARIGATGAFSTIKKTGSYWAGNIMYTDANTNLQFNWSNQINQSHLTNLAGGNYQCILYQDNGCSITKNYSIPTPAPIIVKETITPEVDNDQNGSASLQISGGTEPYYVQWLNTGQIGNQLNQLPEGAQPYFVSDANGCTLNDTIYILRTLSSAIGQGSLSIAPNPGHGFIRIIKEIHGMEDCELTLFDFSGRLIFKSTTRISTLMQTGLDMSHYSDGYYFIVVRDEDQVFQAKANVTR